MDFNMFCNIVKEKIVDYLPPEQDYSVDLITTKKNNCEKVGLCIKKNDDVFAPNIYLESFYDSYNNSGCDIEDALNNISITYAESVDEKNINVPSDELLSRIGDKDYILENVYINLLNNIDNAERLADIPSISVDGMNDISGIFRVMVSNDENGRASYVLNNKHIALLGMSVDDLKEVALANTERMYQPTVRSLNDILIEMGMPDFMLPPENESPMYFIGGTNKDVGGAVSILFKDNLAKLSDKLDSDLILIPSSIHEFLAVPDSLNMSVAEISDMVQEINCTEVAVEDRLSNNVYKFSKKDMSISKVTDVNKNLKGESMTFFVDSKNL